MNIETINAAIDSLIEQGITDQNRLAYKRLMLKHRYLRSLKLRP